MIFDKYTQFHPAFNGSVWVVLDMKSKKEVVECLSRENAIDVAIELNTPNNSVTAA